MALVEEYFDIQEASLKTPELDKSIFVGTDEPRIIDEIKMKYPGFQLVYNESAIAQAQKTGDANRLSNASVATIVKDLFILANAEFLVCTFSSNVGRLAYELHLGLKPWSQDQV